MGILSAIHLACMPRVVAEPPPNLAKNAQRSASPEASLLLFDATIISPERSEPLLNSWVVLQSGKIADIGQGPSPSKYKDIARKNLKGKFLIPGLFDAHVHLQSVPGMTIRQHRRHRELVSDYYRQLPRSYLYHGFTVVLDLAPTSLGFLNELRREKNVPDILHCGPPMPIIDGYPMAFLPKHLRMKVYPNALVDPWNSASLKSLPKGKNVEEQGPEKALQRVIGSRGICAKTFVEDGFGRSSKWPYPSQELLSNLVAVAKRERVPLAIHANSLEAYRRTLEAGGEIVVHGLWTWDEVQDRRPDSSDLNALPDPIEKVLDQVMKNGVVVMPTLRVLAGDGALFDPSFLQDPALEAVLPADMIAWYGSSEGAWFRRETIRELPRSRRSADEGRKIYFEASARAEGVTRYLALNNGKLRFGSDTPSGPSYGNPPGYNGYLELQALAKAGVPLDRLLSAATLENARTFRVEDRYGSIEIGKVAHLLVLRENPLEDVRAYNEIDSVVLRGRWIERNSLRANL